MQIPLSKLKPELQDWHEQSDAEYSAQFSTAGQEHLLFCKVLGGVHSKQVQSDAYDEHPATLGQTHALLSKILGELQEVQAQSEF